MININLKIMTPFIWILIGLNLLFGLSDVKHTKAEISQQESITVTSEGAKKLTQQLIRALDQDIKIIEQLLKENIPIPISIQWQRKPSVSLDEPNGRYRIYYPSLLVTVGWEEVTIPFDALSVTATPRIDGHYLIEIRLPSEISFSTARKITIGEQNYQQLWNPIQNTSELEAVFTDVNFINRQNTISLSQIIITAEEITAPQKTKENDLNAYLSIILENTRSPIGQMDYIEVFIEEELKEGVSILSSRGLNILGLDSHEAGLFKNFDMFSTFFSLEELENSLSNISFGYYHKGLTLDSLPVVFENLYPINLLFDLTIDNIPSEIISNLDKWIENSRGPVELLFNLFDQRNALSKLHLTLYQGDIASSVLTVRLAGRYDPSADDDNARGYLDITVTGIDAMLRILGEESKLPSPNEVEKLFIYFNILKTLGTIRQETEGVPIYHYRLEMTQDGLTLNGRNLSDLGF